MINKLKVIEGGLLPKEQCDKKFISSYVTDTRLMGAMGLFIRWELVDCKECDELVQFFYFDTEEFGFENYQSLWGHDRDQIFNIEHTSIGCLGGKKIPLTEDEACFLVHHYKAMNIQNDLPMPKGNSEYDFIFDKVVSLTKEEIISLNQKTCTTIVSSQQSIHYFLMRLFGKDFEGAMYLCQGSLTKNDIDVFPQFELATFCKNTITPLENLFLCKSIISVSDGYYIVLSEVQLIDLKISGVKSLEVLRISSQEAALILSKREYISVYDISVDPQSLKAASLEIPFSSNCTFHENGRLIMVFKNNNNHVDQPVFTLSDDIYGTYFITHTGQFVLTSYSLKNLHLLDEELLKSSIGSTLSASGKFAFREPILYDFIGSDFDDFIEFVDFIQPE